MFWSSIPYSTSPLEISYMLSFSVRAGALGRLIKQSRKKGYFDARSCLDNR